MGGCRWFQVVLGCFSWFHVLVDAKYPDSCEFSCESVVRGVFFIKFTLVSFHENVLINFLKFFLEVFLAFNLFIRLKIFS